MSSTVFILGAGASKQAGAPLMADFLARAEDTLATGDLGHAAENFELVFEAIGFLQRAHSKAQLPLDHIEHVFSALEMARTLGQFGEYPPEKIARLESAIHDVIVRTLEHTVDFPVREGKVTPPAPYGEFVELIRHLTHATLPRHTVSVLTFNYDLALDFAFHHRASVPYHYGFDESADAGVALLKLHGSLNWHRCVPCDRIYPIDMRECLRNYNWDVGERAEMGRLHLCDRPVNCPTCGRTFERLPLIVPPTWNKLERYRALGAVWARAARELAEAENIFVIGYSLPITDTFFPYLYALSTISMTRIKRFWVFDPDADVGMRFKTLCGPGVQRQFQHHRFIFSGMLHVLENEFPARQAQ